MSFGFWLWNKQHAYSPVCWKKAWEELLTSLRFWNKNGENVSYHKSKKKLSSPVEIKCNFGKEIYCHPLQKYVVIPRNMLQFWQRNMLSSPAKIWCNFGKEIYCHPLQKYVAILAVADFPEGPPLDKGNFGQSDKNVFLLNRTFLHFQLNFLRGL